MATRIENAKIVSTSLGREDHGIFSVWLMLSGEGWGCGFGGYSLDEFNKVTRKREATAYGMAFIVAILETLDVSSWEKLPGTYVRAETSGLGGKITRIGHLLKDKWFDPNAFTEKFMESENAAL